MKSDENVVIIAHPLFGILMASHNRYSNVQSLGAVLFHDDKQLSCSLSPNTWEFRRDDEELLQSSWELAKGNSKKFPWNEEVKEQAYVFLFNQNRQWGGNFFHFHFHELQRLTGFLEIKKRMPNLSLAVPSGMKSYQRDIIDSLIGETKLIELDIFHKSYLFEDCFIGDYANIAEIPINLFELLQSAGKKRIHFEPNDSERLVYIGRRTGKGFAGDKRIMSNKNAFVELLESLNFEIMYFEDYDLEGKLAKLLNPSPRIIVTEIGSGLTNFLFMPRDFLLQTNLVIIDQNNWRLPPSRMSSIFDRLSIPRKIITAESITENFDDIQNNPYKLDINHFEHELSSLIS